MTEPTDGDDRDEQAYEFRDASELTRKACEMWRKLWLEPAIREREQIARAALLAERLSVSDGWRLDVERGVWFRDRQDASSSGTDRENNQSGR